MATIESGIVEAASRLLSATCGSLQTIILVPSKKGLQLQATANGNIAAFAVPYVVEGLKEPVEVQADALVNLIKGRAQVTITANESSIIVKSGTYSGTLHVIEHEALAFEDLVDTTEVLVDPDSQLFLNKVLPRLKIERAHAALPEVMLYGKVTKGSAFLSTYDSYQLCFVRAKPKFDADMEFHVPYSKFQQLIKDVQGITKMQLTNEALMLYAKGFKAKIALPAIDSEAAISPEDLLNRSKETSKSAGDAITLNKEDLQAFIANSTSLVHTGSEIMFSSVKGKTMLKMETPKGSTKAVVESEGKIPKFGLDLRFVNSIIEKNKGEKVTFEVVQDGGYIVCKGSDIAYVAVLSATDETSQE